MPHITLQCSGNIANRVDTSRLLDSLHQALASLETFDDDRIKSRTVNCDKFRVGAGHGDTAFMHATAVFSHGRSDELRTQVGESLLAILQAGAGNGDHDLKVALSVEVRQFEDGMYFVS